MSDKINVMIVEDQAMPRQLFEAIVKSQQKFNLAVSIDNAAIADICCARHAIDLCGNAEAVRVELLPVFHERNASQYKSLQLVARLFKALEIRAARLRSFNGKRDVAVYRLGAFHADAHRKLAVLVFKLHGHLLGDAEFHHS